jgi:hypothetical protein
MPTDRPTDRPERQTELLSAPGANQPARQGKPEFVGALGELGSEIDWSREPETRVFDSVLWTLADAEQVTYGGLTFWHP